MSTPKDSSKPYCPLEEVAQILSVDLQFGHLRNEQLRLQHALGIFGAVAGVNTTIAPLLHPKDAAAYLGVHEKTVIKMARFKQLPALRLGKHWRFREADLASWVESQIQSTRQPIE